MLAVAGRGGEGREGGGAGRRSNTPSPYIWLFKFRRGSCVWLFAVTCLHPPPTRPSLPIPTPQMSPTTPMPPTPPSLARMLSRDDGRTMKPSYCPREVFKQQVSAGGSWFFPNVALARGGRARMGISLSVVFTVGFVLVVPVAVFVRIALICAVLVCQYR